MVFLSCANPLCWGKKKAGSERVTRQGRNTLLCCPTQVLIKEFLCRAGGGGVRAAQHSFAPLFGLQSVIAPTSRGRIHFSRGLWVREHVLLGCVKSTVLYCTASQKKKKNDSECVQHAPGEGGAGFLRGLAIRGSTKELSHWRRQQEDTETCSDVHTTQEELFLTVSQCDSPQLEPFERPSVLPAKCYGVMVVLAQV